MTKISPPMMMLPPAGRLHAFPERPRGFTLLELSIVLAIMGIITAIALPAFQRMQRNSRFSVLNNDLRVFTGAFQHYYSANNRWPLVTTSVGTIPEGMQDYLRTTSWTGTTSFGGGYVWEQDVTHNGRKVRAAISILPTEASPVRMTQVEMKSFDELYDDGNLATGAFQAGYLNLPLYVIEDDPAYVAAATGTPAGVTDQAAVDAAAKAAADAKAAQAVADAAAAQAATDAAAKAAADAKAAQAVADAAAAQAATDAAAKAAADAQAAAAAAAQAKADAIKAFGTAQSTAKADMKQAEKNLDVLSKWADKLDVNFPKSLKNNLENYKNAGERLLDTSAKDQQMASVLQGYQNAQTTLAAALTQYEITLQAAQAKQDAKKR
jgi:prepilin-type N-terminal cleavage/methylation domain-containing protein